MFCTIFYLMFISCLDSLWARWEAYKFDKSIINKDIGRKQFIGPPCMHCLLKICKPGTWKPKFPPFSSHQTNSCFTLGRQYCCSFLLGGRIWKHYSPSQWGRLNINCTKTKVKVFFKFLKKRMKHKWQLGGHTVEQVRNYKYFMAHKVMRSPNPTKAMNWYSLKKNWKFKWEAGLYHGF